MDRVQADLEEVVLVGETTEVLRMKKGGEEGKLTEKCYHSRTVDRHYRSSSIRS